MGAKLLSHYSLKCLCWLPAFPLDEKCKHLSLTARAPAHGEQQLHGGGGQGDSAAGFGFPAKECTDNPAQ